jgi:hypothetical protein
MKSLQGFLMGTTFAGVLDGDNIGRKPPQGIRCDLTKLDRVEKKNQAAASTTSQVAEALTTTHHLSILELWHAYT